MAARFADHRNRIGAPGAIDSQAAYGTDTFWRMVPHGMHDTANCARAVVARRHNKFAGKTTQSASSHFPFVGISMAFEETDI
jgi:hypothetical protein